MNKKKIIIPFSSGVDSTALVHQAVKESHKYDIKLVYFRIQNNETKADREFEACNKIVEQFNILYPNIYLSVKHQIDVHVLGNSGISMFSQMPIWLMGLLYDAVSYIDDIRKIWASYKTICHTKKHPALKFPLIKSKKNNHLNELPEQIRQLTTFCEMPNKQKDKIYSDCGNCDSCNRYKYEKLFYTFTRNQTPITIDSEIIRITNNKLGNQTIIPL